MAFNYKRAAYTIVDQLASVYKESCRYATQQNLTQAEFATNWIGETATGSVESSTFDNFLILNGELALSDRILVKSQTDKRENGIYTVHASGLSRSPDFDGSGDIEGGILVNVMNGNKDSNKIYLLKDIDGEYIVGTTEFEFQPFATDLIAANTAGIATNVADIAATNVRTANDSVQTLTNKTLTSPTITGNGAIAGVFTGGLTGEVTGNASTSTKIASITNANIVQLTGAQTLTNKTMTSPTITGTGAIAGVFTGGLSGEVTGNAATSTKIASITNANIVQLTTTQTLTNKSLTSPTITGDLTTAGIEATGDIDVTGDMTVTGDTELDGTLNVSTAIICAGNITAYSDKRLKENFKLIASPNEKLKMINGYEFDWIKMNNGKHDIGVIAQEIEEVLPELVLQDSKGYKSVDYSKIVSLLIESNKDLLLRIEDLEREKNIASI